MPPQAAVSILLAPGSWKLEAGSYLANLVRDCHIRSDFVLTDGNIRSDCLRHTRVEPLGSTHTIRIRHRRIAPIFAETNDTDDAHAERIGKRFCLFLRFCNRFVACLRIERILIVYRELEAGNPGSAFRADSREGIGRAS